MGTGNREWESSSHFAGVPKGSAYLRQIRMAKKVNMEELIEFSIVAYEMGLSDEKALKFFKEFGKGLVMYEGNLMSVAHAEQLKSLHRDWIDVAHMFIKMWQDDGHSTI